MVGRNAIVWGGLPAFLKSGSGNGRHRMKIFGEDNSAKHLFLVTRFETACENTNA